MNKKRNNKEETLLYITTQTSKDHGSPECKRIPQPTDACNTRRIAGA